MPRSLLALLLLTNAVFTIHAQSLTVIEPDGNNDRVAAGNDYAVNELGNPWDMSDSEDIFTPQSLNVSGEMFFGGWFSATSTTNDPNIWPLHPGITHSYKITRGQLHPVDTTKYRYLAIKARLHASSGPPGAAFYLFEDAGGTGTGRYGLTHLKALEYGQWTILVWDLANEMNASHFQWSDFSSIRGIRFDAPAQSGITTDIDWIRLVTDDPVNKLVTWSSTGLAGQTVDIYAVDSDGAQLKLAAGIPVSNEQAVVDLAILEPGGYHIRLETSGNVSATSSGVISINHPPIFNFTNPDRSGDTDHDYATIESGNPWGPMDPLDFTAILNLNNIRYNDPVGAVTGETTSNDPGFQLATPTPIDTDKYRMLSFKLDHEQSASLETFTIARIIFGANSNPANVYPSEDMIVYPGLRNYVIGDLHDIPLEGQSVPNSVWHGDIGFFRFDPTELTYTVTEHLYDLRLAPFDSAAPNVEISWLASDPDDNATVDLYLDPDTIPGNGNEQLIASGLHTDNDSNIAFDATGIPSGIYNVYASVSDGFNQESRYATGPLQLIGTSSDLIFADGFE